MDLISANQFHFVVFLPSKQYTRFSAARSCPNTVFSEPFITKYPPQSILHSPVKFVCKCLFWVNTQIDDFTMIGILPIFIFGSIFSIIFGVSIFSVLRTIYLICTSTVILDAYVKLRNLASCGNIILVAPLFS